MTRILIPVLLLVLAVAGAWAQQSDYDVQQAFEQRVAALRTKVDSATTTEQLDALKTQIDALAVDFQDKKEFLDKALYPSTLEGRIADLRQLHQVAYGRTQKIQTQGTKIQELELTVADLTIRLDTLGHERERLFADLTAAQKNVSALRDAVKRLTANLQANDRLVFTLVDSMFLPYDRNLSQAGDIEKENVANTIQKSDVLARVVDVANDNVRFLHATQMQPKDYANLLDQYQQFNNRWKGLGDKLRDVAAAAERRSAGGATTGKASGAKGTPVPTTPTVTRQAQVDSSLEAWRASLLNGFWAGIEKEFTEKGVTVNHFTDGPSFSSSIRALVASYKAGNGNDADVFVEQVWKERIDKEWRDALVKDAALGRTEYAALDKAVSELNQKTVDFKLILYILGIVAIALAAWWLLTRKSRKPEAPAPEG